MNDVIWRLRKTYETDNNITELDGCSQTKKLTLISGTGSVLDLPIETFQTIVSDMIEVNAISDRREEALKALRMIRELTTQLPIVEGHEEKAITLIHVLDRFIKTFEE